MNDSFRSNIWSVMHSSGLRKLPRTSKTLTSVKTRHSQHRPAGFRMQVILTGTDKNEETLRQAYTVLKSGHFTSSAV